LSASEHFILRALMETGDNYFKPAPGFCRKWPGLDCCRATALFAKLARSQNRVADET